MEQKNKTIALSLFVAASLGSFSAGCAGPATPFGAVDDLLPHSASDLAYSLEESSTEEGPALTGSAEVVKEGPKQMAELLPSESFSKTESKEIEEPKSEFVDIEFFPKRQQWHTLSEFRVSVVSEVDVEKPEMKVLYNGIDVTDTFVDNSEVILDAQTGKVEYTFRGLRLKPAVSHAIKVGFRPNASHPFVYQSYSEPICEMKELWGVRKTSPFEPDDSLLHLIEQQAAKHSYNPSLISGLIAQESGFRPEAVSYAKAIGLTQVTNTADQEIGKSLPHWPRSEKTRNLPAPALKVLIATGALNGEEDWRLNPELSVEGGIRYIQFLERYWTKAHNRQVLVDAGLGEKEDLLDVILASYNSGAARVKNQIQLKNTRWIMSNKLNEARKYVRKIKSYCYHFSKEEV